MSSNGRFLGFIRGRNISKLVTPRLYCTSVAAIKSGANFGVSSTTSPQIHVDKETVELLEKLSLLNFSNELGIRRLEAAIEFADRLNVLDTSAVKPMYSVQEDLSLYLRPDKVTVDNCREEILQAAEKKVEEYFVVPAGAVQRVAQKKNPNDRSTD